MRFTLLAAATVLLIAPNALPLQIPRLRAPIVIDGSKDDPAWLQVPSITTWYEVDPGDNVPPRVRSEAKLALDAENLYVAFHFFDPDPSQIRAPFSARDALASDADYGGLMIDSQGDGRTAQFFYANPRGVQLDGLHNDATGDDDTTPDFFWDAAARLVSDGWTLELRIPLATLRYSTNAPRWRVLLVRNWARDQRYRIYSARIPRGSSCVICHADIVSDLDLAAAKHVTLVPFASLKGTSAAGSRGSDIGGDVKYSPTASTTLDGTWNPDFSQVESDTLVITSNERFALSYPEKRPFFLEGVQLFDTPLPIVATRTITAAGWGARATGGSERLGYTLLVAEDRGGGSVIIPGRESSSTAAQDFRSRDWIGRFKWNLGAVTLGAVVTDREIAGGGNNRVAGPDLRWTRGDVDVVSLQLLASRSETPRRPDLASEWDGRTLRGSAANVIWRHVTPHWDWYDQYIAFGDGFRSDHGFVPQVGFRELYTNTGYTIRPQGFLNNVRFYVTTDYQPDLDGRVLYHVDTSGADMRGRRNSMFRLRYAIGRIRAGSQEISRNQFLFIAQASPTKRWTLIGAEGSIGQQIDFANARRGSGPAFHFYGSLQPLDRLELTLDGNLQWIERGRAGRAFTAQTERFRIAWAFNVRSAIRVIVQNDHTHRSASLYETAVASRSGSLVTSVLYQYRVTYATGLFIGIGDSRVIDDSTLLWRPPERSFFAKMSYAFLR